MIRIALKVALAPLVIAGALALLALRAALAFCGLAFRGL